MSLGKSLIVKMIYGTVENSLHTRLLQLERSHWGEKKKKTGTRATVRQRKKECFREERMTPLGLL